MNQWLRRLLYWFVSVLVMTVLGAAASTQFVLHELAAIGAPATFSERLSMTLGDIIGMGPLYGAIMALAFLIAFPLAGWLSTRLKAVSRTLLFALAGFLAVLTSLLLMERVFFNLAVIAGARSAAGLAVQALAGGISGVVYAWLSRARN